MAYNPQKHGRADYGKFMQVPWDVLSGIVEGDDSKPLQEQRFAELVYTINPSTLSISGATIDVDSVGLNDTGDVGVGGTDGDQLKTYDPDVVAAIENLTFESNDYTQLIRVSGDFTYIMKAVPGTATTSGDAVFQIKRIEEDGDNVNFTWADGDKNFDNVAADYLTLTYSL